MSGCKANLNVTASWTDNKKVILYSQNLAVQNSHVQKSREMGHFSDTGTDHPAGRGGGRVFEWSEASAFQPAYRAGWRVRILSPPVMRPSLPPGLR